MLVPAPSVYGKRTTVTLPQWSSTLLTFLSSFPHGALRKSYFLRHSDRSENQVHTAVLVSRTNNP